MDAEHGILRVAGAQVPVLGSVEMNAETITYAIEEAASAGAGILLTPEGSLSGYFPGIDADAVDHYLGIVVDKAKDFGVGLALGTIHLEKGFDKPLNQVRFYSRDGRFLGFHAKILRTEGEREDYDTVPLRTFEFDGITIGALICNDLWANPSCTVEPDPHLTRQLARMGARIIFHAVNGGRSTDPFMDVYRRFHESNLRIRAKADGCWIVVADNCYPFGVPCSVRSGVVGPDGNWHVQAPPVNDHVFFHDISLETDDGQDKREKDP